MEDLHRRFEDSDDELSRKKEEILKFDQIVAQNTKDLTSLKASIEVI